MVTATTLAAVAAGGALGASARYLVGAAALRLMGPGFPWGTLFVNVAGSLAMGMLAVLLMERLPGAFPRWSAFLLTGVLGGFTTFSAFSLEVALMLERGEALRAGAYVAASVALGVGALFVGFLAARSL
ncbi:fluoride efflux transporter CrcB [Rubrimonas cliftonensis]|uniref:Fluoride-specific ion channel FluC n=1 Tax=Rubrimonas cliftonensis TaxID=89524 RepID=A0A1H4DVH6_9RHOB|nr:fluoride efflux transporter CrcB [Rubrimonas cliftonensis]SEA76380.1 camphor resistance protein CrcB [Rubrimonas cliftonensis]